MPNLACRLLLWVILCLLLATRSQAAEAEAFRGIWCRSQAQIEHVVTLGRELGGAQAGIIAVNSETEHSCFYGTIIGIRQQAVNTIENPDDGSLLDVMPWRILKVLIIADFDAGAFVPVNMDVDIVRFTLEGSKRRDV